MHNYSSGNVHSKSLTKKIRKAYAKDSKKHGGAATPRRFRVYTNQAREFVRAST